MSHDYINTLLKTSNFLTALTLRPVKVEEVEPELEYLAQQVRQAVNSKAVQIHEKIQRTLEL
ncbi:MAG: hypothetical protein ACM37W_17730 [Actinomycetota bacterium]